MKPGSFLRNVVILGSGTALAQIIPVLASPVLTRLYTPEDFGIFAVFMAFIGIFTPIICGKYEVALVLPKNSVHAEHLLGIALYFAAGISVVLFIIFLLAGDRVLSLLDADRLGNWIFFIPPALLLTGFFTAASYLANRNKQYSLMSEARIVRSLTAVCLSVVAGVIGFRFEGLLSSFLAGLAVASFLLLYWNRSMLGKRVFAWSRAKRWLLCKYRHYPIYNATTGLLNGLTLSLPIFFLSKYFPESTVGYYAIVMRVTSTPLAFISASVSQINLKKVVDLVNAGRPVIPYVFKLAGVLLLIILFPALIIILWGPDLFAFVLGEKWLIAGEYARILMPAIAVQFIASTLSSTLGATNNNRIGALWKVISFLITALVFFVLAPKGKISILLYALCITNLILYCLYFAAILLAAHKPRNFK